MRARYTRGYTPIAVTAALAVSALAIVIAWEWGMRSRTAAVPPPEPMPKTTEQPAAFNEDWLQQLFDAGVVSTTTPGAQEPRGSFTERVLGEMVDSYVALQQSGEYDPKTLEDLSYSLAENVRSPIVYAELSDSDLKTDPDTSYERMLVYRSDLRKATEPLLVNTEAEFAVFARYVETGDKGYLDEMRRIAERYSEAGRRAAAVTVPKDALSRHRAIVNALNEFAAVLDGMARFADDPIASISMLRAYNIAERHVFTAFNSLSSYYASKEP